MGKEKGRRSSETAADPKAGSAHIGADGLADGQGGWCAKIRAVNKKSHLTELSFHDGKQCFLFSKVLTDFKPLT